MNNSIWETDSSVADNVSFDSFNSTVRSNTHTLAGNLIPLSLCVLGLPGNLFVIAVYIRQLTSSTRVYMFALAVADSAVCIIGVVLSTASLDAITIVVVTEVIDVAITFSVFLLTAVSIERALAVTRPHSFNRKAEHAKKAVIYISVVSLLYTPIEFVLWRLHRLVYLLLNLMTLVVCMVTITVCYIVVVVAILNRRKGSKYTVQQRPCLTNSTIATVSSSLDKISAVENTTPSETQESMEMDTVSPEHRGSRNRCNTAKPAPKKRGIDANTARNITLLFVITVVFIVCLLPQLLSQVNVFVPDVVRRLFLVNSVVNPFIYTAASIMFREDTQQFFRQTRATLSRCGCL